MKTTHRILAVLTAGWMVGMGSLQASVMVYSNSFEPADGYPDPNGGTSTGPGLAGPGVVVYDEGNYYSPATDGSQYVVFNYGTWSAGSSFTAPNLNSINQGYYTLTFDFGSWGSGAGIQALQLTVTDTVTSGLLLNITVSDPTPVTSGPMSGYTSHFTGSGNPISIKFLDVSTGDVTFSDGMLDHVLLTVIPEPSAVMLLALGGLLVWHQRRSSSAGASAPTPAGRGPRG